MSTPYQPWITTIATFTIAYNKDTCVSCQAEHTRCQQEKEAEEVASQQHLREDKEKKEAATKNE